MNKKLLTLIGMMLMLPKLAYAHEAPGGAGFMAGFSHPVLGFDHLLAMLSVGILSAQMGGKAIWKIPATFIVIMLVGGVLGINGVHIVSVELGIVCSVLVLGVAIATEKKIPAFVAMIFVGFFAIFHGHAHGAEMPYLAEPMLYACGFVAGTAIIHITGVLIGVITHKLQHGQQLLRYFGAGIAGVGFHMATLLN
ncbi:MAG: HupE/UreJ family protein [Gammaproteobacteria bacterium]|nr:HupE/UreJ family protein [Gammaproteobacteria bacterium]